MEEEYPRLYCKIVKKKLGKKVHCEECPVKDKCPYDIAEKAGLDILKSMEKLDKCQKEP